MMQDALSYDRQLKELKRQNQDFADSGEFLSRIKKEDRLHPVITLVVYWGEDEWQGAKVSMTEEAIVWLPFIFTVSRIINELFQFYRQ